MGLDEALMIFDLMANPLPFALPVLGAGLEMCLPADEVWIAGTLSEFSSYSVEISGPRDQLLLDALEVRGGPVRRTVEDLLDPATLRGEGLVGELGDGELLGQGFQRQLLGPTPLEVAEEVVDWIVELLGDAPDLLSKGGLPHHEVEAVVLLASGEGAVAPLPVVAVIPGQRSSPGPCGR